MPNANTRPYPIVALTTLAFIASQTHLIYLLMPLEPGVLALQLSFTREGFQAVLTQWGNDGLILFLRHFSYDFAHLLIYGAFGYALITHSDAWFGHVRWRRQLALALPLAAFCDLGENLLHLQLLGLSPSTETLLYPIAGVVASMKWGIIAAFTLAVTSIALNGMRHRRSR